MAAENPGLDKEFLRNFNLPSNFFNYVDLLTSANILNSFKHYDDGIEFEIKAENVASNWNEEIGKKRVVRRLISEAVKISSQYAEVLIDKGVDSPGPRQMEKEFNKWLGRSK
ncbi:hypothetical protein KW795_01610 [Candidatus Microgenomates bacterium]|nr:hypothetical protein [Candidatus Microgenomates bacterium]